MFESVRRIAFPGMPNHWQQFLTCLGLHFVLPLLPFGFELVNDGKISANTLTVGGAVYVLALGTSSRNMLLFVMALIFAMLYMVLDVLLTAKNPVAAAHGAPVVWWTVAVIVVFHFGERYNRHIVDRAPYWKFAGGTSDRSTHDPLDPLGSHGTQGSL